MSGGALLLEGDDRRATGRHAAPQAVTVGRKFLLPVTSTFLRIPRRIKGNGTTLVLNAAMQHCEISKKHQWCSATRTYAGCAGTHER